MLRTTGPRPVKKKKDRQKRRGYLVHERSPQKRMQNRNRRLAGDTQNHRHNTGGNEEKTGRSLFRNRKSRQTILSVPENISVRRKIPSCTGEMPFSHNDHPGYFPLWPFLETTHCQTDVFPIHFRLPKFPAGNRPAGWKNTFD